MAEALIEKNNSEIYLSVGDYEKAYNNGELSVVSYINTGILSEIENTIFRGSSWITNSLDYLEMPNVTSIDDTLGPIVVSVNRISAPKLKYVTGNMFYPISSITSLYLSDVETIQAFPSNKILFDNLSIIDYSKLSYITEYVFYNLPNLEYVELPNLEYVGTGGNFCNCPKLKELYLPKISNVQFSLESLPSLERLEIGLNFIGSGGYWSSYSYLYYNYFKDLTNISVLRLENVSTVMSMAFKNLPNLSMLILPNCSVITADIFDINNYIDSLPINLNLDIPKVSKINIFQNIPFKKVTLPAISAILSNQNSYIFKTHLISSDKLIKWGYPYEINFPNLSILDTYCMINDLFNTIFDSFYMPISKLYSIHSLTLNLQNCKSIKYNFSISYYSNSMAYTRLSSYILNVTMNTPNLKYIESFAFHHCGFLTEINLQNVSIIEEGVFWHTYNYYSSSGIKLKNINNIKTVKPLAFCHTRLNSNVLYLPNCTEFDFRQNGTIDYTRRDNITSITTHTKKYGFWFFGPGEQEYNYIETISLPKISEIIIDADGEYFSYTSSSSYQSNCIDLSYDFCSVKKYIFEGCKNIRFVDGISKFIHNPILSFAYTYISYRDSYYMTYNMYAFTLGDVPRVVELLSIPECINLEYVYNSSGYSYEKQTSSSYYFGNNSYHYSLMALHVKELYAPKLQNLSNIALFNCEKINIPISIIENLSVLLYQKMPNSSLNIFFDYELSKCSLFITGCNNLSLPNFKGDLIFCKNVYEIDVASGIKSSVDLRMPVYDSDMFFKPIYDSRYYNAGSYIKKNNTYIMSQKDLNIFIGSYMHRCYIDVSATKNTIFKCLKTTFNNINDVIYLKNIKKIDIPECSMISVNYLTEKITLNDGERYRNFIGIGVTNHYNSCIIESDMDEFYAPKLKTLNMFISTIGFNNSESYTLPLSASCYKYFSIYSDFYAPNFDSFSFTYDNELLSVFNIVHEYIRISSPKVTVGFSELSMLSLTNSTLTYLSLSNLKGIDKGTTMYSNWYINMFRLFLPIVKTLNLDNISYISEYGLAIPEVEQINFSNLRYIENYAFSAAKLKMISIPKIESIGNENLYGCSEMSILTLPPTCSIIGYNAIPRNIQVLQLEYPGIVSASIRVEYTTWSYDYHLCYPYSNFGRIIKVPEAYLSAYRSDSFWGSYLYSYNWNIVAI